MDENKQSQPGQDAEQPVLKVDSDAIRIDSSLFEPIRVEINGKTFEVCRITRKVQQEMIVLDKAYAGGEIDAAFKRLDILLGSHPELDDLDISEVWKLTEDIIRKAYRAPGKMDIEDLKKAAGPGEKR